MSAHAEKALTTHLHAVDLSQFDGMTAFGEPMTLVVSLLLRLNFQPNNGGMMTADAVFPKDEGDALLRAVRRAGAAAPRDRRTEEQRDADGFQLVVRHVHDILLTDNNGPQNGVV